MPTRHELAENVKRLAANAANASFDCGAWRDDDDEKTEPYERVFIAAAVARDALHAAIDTLRDAPRDAQGALIDVATGKLAHVRMGLCPDDVEGFGVRDPDCPACRAILAAPSAQPAPEAPAGLSIAQEPKYTVTGSAIVNRASGEAIPADEPVFVFRARDLKAIHALRAYSGHVTDAQHRAAVTGRIADFLRFAGAHPERMKEPDTAPTPVAQAAPSDRAELGAECKRLAKRMATELCAMGRMPGAEAAEARRGEPAAWVDPLDIAEKQRDFMACSHEEHGTTPMLRYTMPLFAGPAARPEPLTEAVLKAAGLWWQGKRPVAWTREQHLAQPAVNTQTGREHALATAVAAWLSSEIQK